MNLAWGVPLWIDNLASSVPYTGLTERARDMLSPPGGARHQTLAQETIERRSVERQKNRQRL